MRKILLIGLKDVKIAFRDRAALILMLAAPFVLTLGLGFVTGRLSGSSNAGLSQIPLVIVNQDQAQLGDALQDLFHSAELAELVLASDAGDPAAARALVDADETAAAVIIPDGFSESIIPMEGSLPSSAAVEVEIYANPTRPVSAGVVQAIVEEFASRVEIGRAGGQVAVTQLIVAGLIQPGQAEAAGREMGARFAAQEDGETLIRLESETSGAGPVEFDVLSYMAPGMALLFLMYTVSYGGRTILEERSQGTLPRLLVSPTRAAEVLGGKVLGIYLTGVAQLFILIGASTLLFSLKWGDAWGVILLVLAAVFGATGWGMLITAIARTPGQVASTGSAIMLTFGILGGSFVDLQNLPAPVQWLSMVTPNKWGLDGFTALAQGGGLPALAQPLAALLVIGGLLFGLAVVIFSRQGGARK